ncbi:MAG: NeuD/PglB/VioB family sugar acetyltransferase [bacterium]|jgi:sugar O-acyltransferase (sialic acid O-acetyltransferase NeuD family)
MENVLVFGTGGCARGLIECIEFEGKYRIAGLIDDNRAAGFTLFGYRVLGGIADLRRIGIGLGIIGIGDNWNRRLVAEAVEAAAPGFRYITIISPLSRVHKREVEIGEGTLVAAFSYLDSSINIGRHCIIDTSSMVSHDTKIGDFVNLHPKATICGTVRVGECSTLSVGTNVIQGVTIGEHTVIGAGSTVVQDIPAYSVAYGVPCRVVRQRQAGEAYL